MGVAEWRGALAIIRGLGRAPRTLSRARFLTAVGAPRISDEQVTKLYLPIVSTARNLALPLIIRS